MLPKQRQELEREIRQLWEGGELGAAAAVALRGYGPELFGFLVAFHRREADAREVYAAFTERLWRGLPQFGWSCSFRTWAYAIARNASLTYRRDERRRAQSLVPLPEGSQLSLPEQAPRSDTASYLKTQRKARVAALREALPEADQELLVLRVDRGLAFSDLARVMSGAEAGELSEEELRREAARLRKRFQVIKARLLELGRREGLLGPQEE